MDKKEKCILVIDDSNTNVVLLHAVLTNKGYQIETALSAKEAFNSINKNMPDLILLDLLMPRMNGFDFLKELKAGSQISDIPVIVVSALTDDENIQKALDLGAVGFVKKPIDIAYLFNKIEKVLMI
jgi:CheY-like chemotaxis protein